MAIAFDFSNKGTTAGNQASLTVSHTCTGSNLALIVAVTTYVNADPITSVTYNGVPMTQISKQAVSGFGINNYQYMYGLLSPATGANNIVVNVSPNSSIDLASASYTGVKQSGLPDAFNTGNATGTAVTASVTTIADNCWVVVGVCIGDVINSVTGGSLRNQMEPAGYSAIMDNNAAKTPAGSVSVIMNLASSSGDFWSAVSIAPFTGGGGATLPFRSLLGVGI